LSHDPDNIDGLNSLAQCVKSIYNCQVSEGAQSDPQSLFTQLRSLYQKALSVDPEDFETNFNLGVLYYEYQKDYTQAIHFLKVAINEEANAAALFNLAIIYEEKGDRNDAKQVY
jgi:tetratricopeptide (TPR) repeat protein